MLSISQRRVQDLLITDGTAALKGRHDAMNNLIHQEIQRLTLSLYLLCANTPKFQNNFFEGKENTVGLLLLLFMLLFTVAEEEAFAELKVTEPQLETAPETVLHSVLLQ